MGVRRCALRSAALGLATLGVVTCGELAPEALDSEAKASLDEVIRSAVDDEDVPGVVALVVTSDGVLYQGAFGVMDPGGDVAMRTNAIFQIFSMTKPVTSVGIMMLAEDGLLDLDSAASAYLPELNGREVFLGFDSATGELQTRPAARQITVRDLLRHTSGFGYSFSNQAVLDLIRAGVPERDHPLVHDPGGRWTYGMSTAFLGWIIEEVSGESLPDFFRSRIFEPLGMGDTGFDLRRDDYGRLAATYRRVDGELRGEPLPEQYQPTVRGDYGLLSTASDYGRFLQMILGSGVRSGVRLLSERSVEEMATDQLSDMVVTEQPGVLPSLSRAFPLGAGTDGFGLGFQIGRGESTGRSPGSLSWAGLRNTHFWIDIERGIGVVLLVQMLPFYEERVIQFLSDFEPSLYANLSHE